jgi:hypothetical protein
VVGPACLQGVWGFEGAKSWCFCGEFVVDCVVERGEKAPLFVVRKIGQVNCIFLLF